MFMLKRFVLVLTLLAISFVNAQADTVLQRVADGINVGEIKTLQYTANGVMFSVGQSATPFGPLPRYYVKSYTRNIDFNNAAMREEIVRTQGEDPPRGGGGQPITGEQRQIQLVQGDYAWNEAAKEMAPRFWEAADRQHQIWVTPQGFVRAALAHEASSKPQTVDGRKMTVISFTMKGKMKADAYVNDENIIERIDSWYGHPVIGDTKVQTHFSGYRDFAGIKFPGKIVQYQDGNPTLDLDITAVRVNQPISISTPENVRTNPAPVKMEKAADGVWHIGGGSHNSALIEMKDYLIVVEGPQGDERSAAVIAEVKKTVPGKPIRYLVNTHHHFDHSSGVRAYALEGATIVTHELNRAYFERAAANSRNFSPDRLAKAGKKPAFQAMGDNMVLTDGTRSVELYQIGGNPHHQGLVMAYLRKEKILIEADAFTPGPAGAEPPKVVNPFTVNLEAQVRRLNIDVEKILPLHGRIVPYSELIAAIGKKPAPAKK
jgi:glyoxylase-like metal-dependent hydrolase (beta-lactamase superfamily II)